MNEDRREDGEGHRTATQRMRESRERQRNAQRRGRQLKVAGAVVALLVVGTGVGALVAQQAAENGRDDDAKPIAVGKPDAPAKLTVYEDFRCPACGQFEKQFRGTIRGLEKKGRLRTEYHLVTIIDDNLGGRGSRRAANAAACAEDQGRFRQFHDVLYRNQPPEQEDAFAGSKRLLALAGKVRGLDGPAFRACVDAGTHDKWVRKTAASFKKSGHQSTPTVLLDGESIYGGADALTPASLKEKVEAAG
ncbi:thioredoxin domain-containing protein [Streptomyces sp. HNM0575]|uniref:DsbA family protein n=1 Tax=Streptomyces sp. HNM0575 TaxID=2716338 RepID=UPI00145FAFE9|nr:thioredoxin domain-containing protein [Streptomyces sp. HNM0575]NLU74629.1 thioredoxin domain-containing protein [Streptomyces sp. HNM0575]